MDGAAQGFPRLLWTLSDDVSPLQGFALVGLGSFIFHATLQYEAQLADELPMIYVASYCTAVLFDLQPGFSINNARSRTIITLLLSFNILFTWV